MKINRLSLVAGLALAGLLCLTTAARAQDDNKESKKGKRQMPTVEEQMARFDKELSLTDDQKPKVKKVLEDSDKKRKELFESGGSEEVRPKMRVIGEEQDKKLKEILTADQYKTYEEKLRFRPGGKKKGDGEKKDDTK